MRGNGHFSSVKAGLATNHKARHQQALSQDAAIVVITVGMNSQAIHVVIRVNGSLAYHEFVVAIVQCRYCRRGVPVQFVACSLKPDSDDAERYSPYDGLIEGFPFCRHYSTRLNVPVSAEIYSLYDIPYIMKILTEC